MKPLGDGFIKLIKMVIAPIIFCTVVLGIAGTGDLKKVGRTGGLALLYFEVVSTSALILGLLIVNVVRPGAGMNVDVRTLDASAVSAYAGHGKMQSTTEFLLNVIPSTFVDAFAKGEILQVLLLAVLFGIALQRLGAHRNAGLPVHREVLRHSLRTGADDYEGGADRRFRRHGVHHRRIRSGIAALARQTHGHVLPDLPLLHFPGTRQHRPLPRLQHLEIPPLHPRGAPDRARHLVLRSRPAAHDGQDGKPRRRTLHRRPGDPGRLLLQPGRHVDLPDDGRRLRRAGDQLVHDGDRTTRCCSPFCC